MLAVDRVSRGQRYCCSEANPRPHRASQRPVRLVVNLTARETQILKLITDGLTTKEIAARLFISVPTVETHRGSLFKKTGSRNVAGLVRFAIETGEAAG